MSTTIKDLIKYGIKTNTDLIYNQRLFVLENLLSRISKILLAKKNLEFVFRGSLFLRNWVFPYRRIVQDLDFLGIIPYDIITCKTLIESAVKIKDDDSNIIYFPNNIITKKTWENTDFPGVRIYIPFSFKGYNNYIQVDIGFNDSIFPAPYIMDYKNMLDNSFQVPTVPIELALAWKVHGLFEFWDKGGSWSSKTLYDIHLMLSHFEVDQSIFQKVLMNAFEERCTPLSTYDRVLNQTFGRSKGSRKSWKRFIERNQLKDVPKDHIEIIEHHRKFLDPFFIK